MSNSKKHRKRGRGFPWVAVAFAGVLLVAAAVLLLGRNGDSGGLPVASVDTERIDFGDVVLDTPKQFSFTVTNTGNGTLRFKDQPYAEVLEGC
jgi:hypothetical protein